MYHPLDVAKKHVIVARERCKSFDEVRQEARAASSA